jgi:hypothetical protein
MEDDIQVGVDLQAIEKESIEAVGDSIDKLVSITVTGRPTISSLYRAAREKQGRPLCLMAAEALARDVSPGDVVFISCGMPTFPWIRGEQDGPVGAATLARALLVGLAARPIILTEPLNAPLVRAALVAAGLYVSTVEDAIRFPSNAAVIEFPIDREVAQAEGRALLDSLNPKAMIAIEKPGANEHGEYHTFYGRSLSPWVAKPDAMFAEASRRGVVTIGIGDNGNEFGSAVIRDFILREVPLTDKCHCPCGGSTVPATPTDILIMAAVSNLGASGIEACLAAILKRPEVLHDGALDLRVHLACAAAGATNGSPGLLDPGTDGVPAPIYQALLVVMKHIVEASLDPTQMYRDPTWPWLIEK